LGLRYRRAGYLPAGADPDAQRAFHDRRLAPRLAEAAAGRRRVFFVDAAHFTRGAYLACVWCLVRLFVPTGSGRQRYRVLGALDAVTRRLTRVTTTGSVNRETAVELLTRLRADHPVGRVAVVLDNARYFRNRVVFRAARRLRIHLLFLPPYSPNLNLIERVWKFVKRVALQGRYQEDFAGFQAAIDRILGGLDGEYAAKMASLLTWNFQTFDDTPILTD
jgi:transposase